MKEKKIIQYVDFKFGGGEPKGLLRQRKCFHIDEMQCSGMNGIRVVVNDKAITALKNGHIKKLEKILKGYDLSEAVVTADNEMAKVLNITDMLFEARKYELLRNCSLIMNVINQRFPAMATVVVVIGSNRWNMKDLFSILTVIKNYFRKIDIVMEYQIPNITSLVEAAYEEWGVVIHAYTLRNYHRNKMDFALLLLNEWKYGNEKRIPYNVAYLVTDEGSEAMLIERGSNRGHNIFCGLVYKAGNELLYSRGTQIAWQKPVLYEKIHVSVVDICELR